MGRSRPRNRTRQGGGAAEAPSPQRAPASKRNFFVPVAPASEESDREVALADAANEAMRQIHSMDRLGGTLVITPVRVGPHDPIGEYETTGFVFSWDTYAPGMTLELPEPESAAEPPPEPEQDAEPEQDDGLEEPEEPEVE